jgi:hypothetical protein
MGPSCVALYFTEVSRSWVECYIHFLFVKVLKKMSIDINHVIYFPHFDLKVHKHEIYFFTFLQKPKPYGPKGLYHDIFESRIQSAEIFDF